MGGLKDLHVVNSKEHQSAILEDCIVFAYKDLEELKMYMGRWMYQRMKETKTGRQRKKVYWTSFSISLRNIRQN